MAFPSLLKEHSILERTNKHFRVYYCISSKGGAYRLNFPFVHLVKEMYGEKVGQKWMDNEFKMATVDGWKMKV